MARGRGPIVPGWYAEAMLIARVRSGLLAVVMATLNCTPLSVDPTPTPPSTTAEAAPIATATASAVEIAPIAASPAPELFAAASPTTLEGGIGATPESASVGPLPPLTADTAMDQVVERAPLPPEARFLARTLRPTMVAEFDGAGRWIVSAGIMGQWRVDEQTWQVEPFDGTAELWDLQSRLDLR
jgi:hypothetical protein